MKLTVIALAFAFAFPAAAGAHLVKTPDHPKRNQLENRLVQQTENVKHARYVCRHGSASVKRWHCKAVVWLVRERTETRTLLRPRVRSVPDIIRAVFGPNGDEAVTVARCETGGTFDVNARNGQYLGLFQMGSYARSRYGHGPDAWSQARAAYGYFRDAGWSPWQCGPYGGLQW